MNPLNIRDNNSKFFILIVLLGIVAWWWANTFLSFTGRNFPLESQLKYSEGILTTKNISPRGREHLFLNNSQTNTEIEFSCGYSAYDTINNSDCRSPVNFPTYNGQSAKIGWYYQDDFFGFHNSLPQAVTVQVGDKQILTYEHVVEINKKVNKGAIKTASLFSILVIIIGFYIYFLPEKK